MQVAQQTRKAGRPKLTRHMSRTVTLVPLDPKGVSKLRLIPTAQNTTRTTERELHTLPPHPNAGPAPVVRQPCRLFGGQLTELESYVLHSQRMEYRVVPAHIWMHCDCPEDYLSQFLPHTRENLRCDIAAEIRAMRSRATPQPGVLSAATYHPWADYDGEGGGDDAGGALRYLTLTSRQAQMPLLNYALTKVVVCLSVPGSRRYALGIADGPRGEASAAQHPSAIPDPDPVVEVTVRLLAESFDLLRYAPQVEWLPVTSLVSAERLFHACSRHTVPALLAETDLRSPAAWPEEPLLCPDRAQRISDLNERQRSVVNRLSTTNARGIYNLLGPPGTGKTTTIVHLLSERARQFPDQRILLTAPSNKAVQVVLTELLRRIPDPPAVAWVSAPYVQVSADLERVSPGCFTDGLLALFRGPNLTLAQACTAAAYRLHQLLDRPGMSVYAEVRAGVESLANDLAAQAEAGGADDSAARAVVLRRIEAARQTIEHFMVQQAQIVFATLSTSGKLSLAQAVQRFDCLVVDEASQALIPETLIPFRYDPALCVLVGDPQQLPGLVHSDRLRWLGYEDSLMHTMTRFQQRPFLERLTTQYRMHPGICDWISRQFYGGELVADLSLAVRPSPVERLPEALRALCSPSTFIDCAFAELNDRNGLISNPQEAGVLMAVAKSLLRCGLLPEQLGIITFYAAQVELLTDLREQLARELPGLADLTERLTISTVDGFQGDERDVTLISCVRTAPNVGFLSDHRRINVALSRARHARWVFGHAAALSQSKSAVSQLLVEALSTMEAEGGYGQSTKVVGSAAVLDAVRW